MLASRTRVSFTASLLVFRSSTSWVKGSISSPRSSCRERAARADLAPVRRRPLGGRRVHVGGLGPRAAGRLDLRVLGLPLRLGRRRGHRVARVLEPAPRHHRLAGLQLADRLGRVLHGQRAHVAPVEGRHRRHVAGAEALELAQVQVGDALRLRLLGERVVDAARVPQVAGDARAHVHVAARRPLGAQHVVEGRDARQVGGRHLHHRGHLADRLGRAPAVHLLGGAERRERGGVAVGIEAHQALDLGAQRVRAPRPPPGPGSSRDRPRGRRPRPSRAGASSPGSRPRRAPPAMRSAIASGPPRRGSGRASPRR